MSLLGSREGLDVMAGNSLVVDASPVFHVLYEIPLWDVGDCEIPELLQFCAFDYWFEVHAFLNSHAAQLFVWLRIFVSVRSKLWPLSTQCDAMRDALMLQPYSCSMLLNPCGKLFQGLPCVLKVTGTVLALGLILALTWLHAELSTQSREAIAVHANSLKMRAFTNHLLS